MENNVLSTYRFMLSYPGISLEAKRAIAEKYRSLHWRWIRNDPDFAKIDREIEKLFSEHGV
jgi:hypothetical protein